MYRRRFPSSSLLSNLPPEIPLNHIKDDGFKGFLSPKSTHLLLNSYHLHLRSVAELAYGSPANVNQASKDLFRIIGENERDEVKMGNPRLLHHASQAWNLEFFLRGLSNKEIEPPSFVINLISKEFGSFDNFKRNFQAHASAMIGCGWIWLVKSNDNSRKSKDDLSTITEQANLSILTTFNGATPLFKSDKNQPPNHQKHISTVKNSPILGLNLWESAFILDYSLDRDLYVRNWWKAINWNVSSVLLSK